MVLTKRGTGLHRGHYAQGQPDGGPGQPTATVKERGDEAIHKGRSN